MTNWNKTKISNCRYASIAKEIWGEHDILWERSEPDYQGSAEFIAFNEKTGTYSYYEWSWGSCFGCDIWESKDYTNYQIRIEMLNQAAWFESKEHMITFVQNIIDTTRSKEKKDSLAIFLRQYV